METFGISVCKRQCESERKEKRERKSSGKEMAFISSVFEIAGASLYGVYDLFTGASLATQRAKNTRVSFVSFRCVTFQKNSKCEREWSVE